MKSADYIRSKALIPFVGKRLVEWVVEACRDQGIRRFFVVAHGLENRNQIKLLLGHGEHHGVEVRYSRSRLDRYNVGSAGATLHNLEQWDLQGQALVLPVDSLFDFDLAAMRATHDAYDALVTVAAVARTGAEIAGKYGVMRTDARGLVTGFVEKPPLAGLRELFPQTAADERATLPTNAGCTWWTAGGCACWPASPACSGSPTSGWTGAATCCPGWPGRATRSPPTPSAGSATWATYRTICTPCGWCWTAPTST
ncbi:sugar phosphate nucleotidyltransferase [Streptomyces diastatochromogenes]|nr:sugar phosphate nucleotidyltransferase [Streptomyces diastatochromogenes]